MSKNYSEMTPEDILKEAERTDGQPPPPDGGIPKQRLPGWIRWPVRVLFIPFILLDLTAQRLVKFFIKTPYRQMGKCKRRGNCCYFIIMPAPSNWMTKLNYFWQTEINGFYARDSNPIEVEGERLMVMGCRYLQKNGSCGHHRLRPVVCREWPRIECFGPPGILKGCGYHAKPRDKNFDPFPQKNTEAKSKLNVIK
ncbi:MAG: hypothetical protein VX777_10020 [Chlamydiota bacterium]|nr:hypothetical protein [Chlamydiota bacterium]